MTFCHQPLYGPFNIHLPLLGHGCFRWLMEIRIRWLVVLDGYPLVNIQKAIENGPVEIVSFLIKNGDFP